MFKWRKEIRDLLGKISAEILKLRTKDTQLEERVKIAEEQVHQLSKALDVEIGRLNNKVEARLIDFHKEVTDRYFGTLERVYRYTKEITLIDQLANSIKDKDLLNLKRMMMAPMIEARKADYEKGIGDKIDEVVKTQGQKLLDLRNALHEEMIVKERKEQPIAGHKAKIELIDKIIGGKI